MAPAQIDMAMSGNGWLRPVQHAPISPEAEARIAEFCPGHRMTLDAQARPDHRLWGPIIKARTGHASDTDLRHQGSSGGVISAIATYLLASGEAEIVLQNHASADNPVGNEPVQSRSAADVFAAAGSRYYPSAPLADLNDALNSRKKIAFIGKPCDVAALRGMARSDPRIDKYVVIAISFFCAGVPSHAGAMELLDTMGTSQDEIETFRYRGDGWPGYATAQLKDGTKRSKSYAESWGSVLSRHIQKRCKLCPDGTGGFADLVCADAWETDPDGYPLFEEREGISLILSRTPLGEALIQRAVQAQAIKVADFDAEQIAPMQPGQVRKRQFLLSRLLAMRVLFRKTPYFWGFHLAANAKRAGWKANLRQFAGMSFRELTRR
ncbi:Coenzyme F420 hydrogenase/dehydrogenase, beta subunit C-terminal domain [uncultured Tateyamaria sp.]|uniref:Coenzyme F420 hydrogenase/dehydrogenase, beta subunit C-terminal domain n=1 Tax=uncultured Tateyamaria sp. TaxID=455651 RepID=UPI0026398AC3|nr:Coenzyme F420 hydrogenase/dehydrogenase, beta subunit C-terminal domain [uncultured Tateyamaria sp.]